MTRSDAIPPAHPGFRIETAGPALDDRGGLYGVGQASCHARNGRRAFRKRYSAFAIGAVEAGVFRYGTKGAEVLAVPGTILFGNAGETFTCEHLGRGGNRRSVISVGSAVMAEAAEALALDDVTFRATAVPSGPESAALYGRVRRLAQSKGVLEDALIELLAIVLGIGRSLRTSKRHRRELVRVLDLVKYLEHHFAEAHRLERLAARARLSRFHFIRVFRDATGVTPQQFLIGLRLRAAAERLQGTAQPITELALEAGFNDLSHFNRTFRRAFGMTPSGWRARS